MQVAEVHNDIQNNAGSSKQSPEGQLARAKALERGGDWSGAIDAYLAITTQDTTDLDFLEGVGCLSHSPHGPEPAFSHAGPKGTHLTSCSLCVTTANTSL